MSSKKKTTKSTSESAEYAEPESFEVVVYPPDDIEMSTNGALIQTMDRLQEIRTANNTPYDQATLNRAACWFFRRYGQNIDQGEGGSVIASEHTNLKKQHPPVAFCGLDALVRRLTALATQTGNLHVTNEINAVVADLSLLDNSLHRLRYERSLVDEQDIDLAIDRLRCVQQGGE